LRSRLTFLSIAVFVLLAVVGWWMVIEEGPSAARVLGAAAGTVGAVVQIIARTRGSGRGRSGRAESS
jgi:heme A synthase